MDIKRALRNVRDTGKVTIGFNMTLKKLKKKEVKLVIVSNNCPKEDLDQIKTFKVPIYTFNGTNVEFGSSSGKPFSISTMGIVDAGKSDILALKGEVK